MSALQLYPLLQRLSRWTSEIRPLGTSLTVDEEDFAESSGEIEHNGVRYVYALYATDPDEMPS